MGLAAFNRSRRLAAQGAGVATSAVAPAPAAPTPLTSIPDNWRELPWIPKAGETGIRAVASLVAEGPFKNKDAAASAIEAHLAKQAQDGGNLQNPKDEPVDIPEAWVAMTDEEMVELALAIVGGEGPLVPSEGQTVAEKARAIITATVEKRTA